MAPRTAGGGVRSAALLEVEDPTASIWPLSTPVVAVAGLATAEASGTALDPVPISTTFDDVALKLVCASEISLLSRSYTTYADRRKVSPSTDVPLPAGARPKRQAAVPSGKGPEENGIMSSSMVTEMVTEVKVKLSVVSLFAKEHGTYAAP